MKDVIQKILITGGSGTIGTRLCEKLLKKDYEIVSVDWKENVWNKNIDNLTIDVDLRNKQDVLQKLPKDIDIVIHLAANARVYNLVVDPFLARDNFETLFNILEYSRQNNIQRFIFASSREVYGNSNKVVHKENESYVKNCESPYTASKIGGEAFVNSYQQCYGINFINFRFSNVYGMYDNSNRVIPLFIKLCSENKDLIAFGKNKLLDFTYIDDCVSGIIKGIENFTEVKNDTYNIGSGEGTSIINVAQLIQEFMKSKNDIIIKENRNGEIVKFVADISKAREKLGYIPRVKISNGIKETIQWYSNKDTKIYNKYKNN